MPCVDRHRRTSTSSSCSAGWLRGTHQGATSPAQLDWYLDEFTFRYNRRSSTHRGLLFYRLLEEAVVTPPVPYRRVVGS